MRLADDKLENKSSLSDVAMTAVREQTARLLADPLFRHSRRYSNLLKFIVERTLSGSPEDLRERTLGIEVFNRNPNYDTNVDPTVRVTATEVRKRLALYYAPISREREVRISVPVGSYVAEFKFPETHLVPAAPPPPQANPLRDGVSVDHIAPAEAAALDVSSPSLKGAIPMTRYMGIGVACLLLAALLWGAHTTLSPVSAVDKFWSPVEGRSNPVLICIGTSSDQPNVGPDQPFPRSENGNFRAYELPPERARVPMTDVNTAMSLAGFLGAKTKGTVLRTAPTVRLSDLASAPVILLGSFDNQWTMQLGKDLRFRFVRTSASGDRWIEDATNPGSKTDTIDLAVPLDTRSVDGALVNRVLDSNTGQWWIGVGGLTGLGTVAAEHMLIDSKAMEAIVAQLPTGWENRNLQLVLSMNVVNGSPGAPRVVAVRSW